MDNENNILPLSDIEGLMNFLIGKFSGLNDTYRFSGTKKIKEQSVAEHSYWTAIISGCLARYENRKRKEKQVCVSPIDLIKVYEQSLFHDVEEVITGDINHVFKNDVESKVFKEELQILTVKVINKVLFEKMILGDFYFDLWKESHLDTVEFYFVKMGDWLQLFQYCFQEVQMGNSYFNNALRRVLDLIEIKNNSEKQKGRIFFAHELISNFILRVKELEYIKNNIL